jgi:hypothetical protein
MTDEQSLLKSVSQAAKLSEPAVDSLTSARDADLFAALGYQLSQSSAGSTQGGYDTEFDPDDLPRDTAFQDLGKRLFKRWNKTLHEFVCGSSSEDKALRDRLLGALMGKEGGAAALLAGTLVAVFGVSPALSAVIATLVIRLVVKPAAGEICESWKATI